MSIDPKLLEILARKKKKKKSTKMIRDPFARGKEKLTSEQLRIIKQQKDAEGRRRQRRDEELQKRRRAAIEREKERQAHRKAQEEERERLAMRDTFEKPDDDDEYDPYTDPEYLETLYGGKDELKLRF